ncbi:MAG: hypothetical protein AB7I35_13995 [Ramlibacter sp.]
MNTLQAEITRMAFAGAILSALGFAVTMWVLYIVIKAAIRDGINESRLTLRRDQPAQTYRSTAPAELPDMRAER